MTNESMSAAERYRAQTADKQAVLVDVTVPSGFVFKFEKPSKYSMLFTMGSLPVSAVNGAVESWKKDGVTTEESSATAKAQDKIIQTVMSLRDKVIELSKEPKLVVGRATNDNEISTDDIADDDLEYLFKWVTAGGDAGVMLAMFPQGSPTNSLASANRPKQRAKAK